MERVDRYGHEADPEERFARCARQIGKADGLLITAGFDPKRVMECHGSIHQLQCMDDVWSADDFEPTIEENRCELTNALSRPLWVKPRRSSVPILFQPGWKPKVMTQFSTPC